MSDIYIDDEKLIDLVKANSCLYNKLNINHKLLHVKRNVWKAIAKEMNATDEQCIKRWTSLREKFGRECRKLDEQSGSTNSFVMWPLFQRMMFIKEHIFRRTSRADITAAENLSSPIKTSSPTPTAIFCSTLTPSPKQQAPWHDDLPDTSSNQSAYFNVKEVFSEEAKLRRAQHQNEAVLSFTSMIAAKLSAMPPSAQAKMMLKLHQVLLEGELEHYFE